MISRQHIYRRLSGFSFLTLSICVPSVALCQPSDAPDVDNFKLTGDIITIPLVMVREFPFIEGQIAGVKGKLMLDTGMQRALTINDRRVPLENGVPIGNGFFGSGQKFEIRRHRIIKDLRVSDLHFDSASNVNSQDSKLLEGITPDFIGWLGYDFFKNYAMKLDYKKSKVTFYKGNSSSFLSGEAIVAVIPFSTRRLPNHPIINASIGNIKAVVNLDTGMNGELTTSRQKRGELLASRNLILSENNSKARVLNVRFEGGLGFDFSNINISDGPSPASEPMGITEDVELEIGYALTSKYKTVWDFPNKRIYVMKYLE